MSDPKRERGELRVPVLPEVLRTPPPAGPPPQLPVLSGPVSRRRRRRRAHVGLGMWLGLVAVGLAAGAAALVLAQPSGDRATTVESPAVSTPAPAPKTTPAPPVAKPPPGPFRFASVREPPGVLAAVARSGAVLLGSGVTWILGGESGGKPVDAISRVSSGRVAHAGAFEEPLAEAGFAAHGGSLYLAGGFTGEKYGTAVLRFTPPSGTGALLARLPAAVRGPSAALLGHRLYVAGGRTASGPSRALFVVDVASGTVRTLARLPRLSSGAALVALAGTLYLLDGKRVFRIDPASGSARPAGTLPVRLRGAVSLGTGALVVAGGRTYRLSPAR